MCFLLPAVKRFHGFFLVLVADVAVDVAKGRISALLQRSIERRRSTPSGSCQKKRAGVRLCRRRPGTKICRLLSMSMAAFPP